MQKITFNFCHLYMYIYHLCQSAPLLVCLACTHTHTHPSIFCSCMIMLLELFLSQHCVCFCGCLCWFVFWLLMTCICEETETVGLLLYICYKWHNPPFMSLKTLVFYIYIFLQKKMMRFSITCGVRVLQHCTASFKLCFIKKNAVILISHYITYWSYCTS